MSVHNLRTRAPFRLFDVPKELRLMIYELLPVARIHRKIHDFPTLVVIWSPTNVLLTCRAVKEEAANITNNTVKNYKRFRHNVLMQRRPTRGILEPAQMLVAWIPTGPKDLNTVSSLIATASKCSNYILDTGNLLCRGSPIPNFIQSLRDQDAARHVTEWVWQTGRRFSLDPDSVDLDIAVTVSDDTKWHASDKFGSVFTKALTEPNFEAIVTEALLRGRQEAVTISFGMASPVSSQFFLMNRKDLGAVCLKVVLLGYHMEEDEHSYKWAEDEWI
ncbi:hypothetical protein C7974DRAFT_414737 [Boeremia exigua]|uniref:uncharacterized protein n=1 Tax=Boeremia exigua TaxID=749465 RepID=UPI001E8E9726|nr:uncharacterized protein C7974DRAFT_414737 [Boeremia exigua]KAH6622065.1 hypothetical protein C7974DRAFT_414737 [Boeremia exigua]